MLKASDFLKTYKCYIYRKSHGRALMLDGVIQTTEKDEMAYHEMISYLPLCSHPKPQHVSITIDYI